MVKVMVEMAVKRSWAMGGGGGTRVVKRVRAAGGLTPAAVTRRMAGQMLVNSPLLVKDCGPRALGPRAV